MRRIIFACSSILFALPGCGGCGDSSSQPDAEVGDDDVPDAAPPDSEPPDDPRPGPVTDLTAVPDDPADLDLGWTNPTDADLAGVVVVVGSAAVTFTPTDGTTYTADQDLGGGERVLFAGAGTSTTLAATVIGTRYHFAAWAYDAAGQFSTAATVSGVNQRLGAQTATLSIALDGTVTVTAQPANLTLSGTAVYTDGTDSIDLDLTVRNDTPRLLFNLKALTTAQNEGAQDGTTFPLTGGQPSTYFGPESIDVAASETRTLNLTGITGATDPITLTLSFVDAPMLYSAHYSSSVNDAGGRASTFGAADTSGSGEEVSEIIPYSPPRVGAISPDGKFLYTGTKNETGLLVIDTRTLTPVAGAELGDAAEGNLGALALTADGSRLLVVVNDGAHRNGANGDTTQTNAANTEVQLVELDADGLSELRRVTLFTADAARRQGYDVRLSPDESRAAVVVGNGGKDGGLAELWFVDLDDFTIVDTDAGTAGTQPVALGGDGDEYAAQARWVGTSVYVSFSQTWNDPGDEPVDLEIVDTETFAVTELDVSADVGGFPGLFVVHGGAVYYPTKREPMPGYGLVKIQGGTVTPLLDLDEAVGVVFEPGGERYFAVTPDGTYVVDASTDTAVDTDGDDSNGVTPFPLAAVNMHFLVLSPF